MIQQTSIDRRKAIHRLWKDLGKRFLLILAAAWLIICITPLTRTMPLAYLTSFLTAFAISWVWMFRKKELRKEFQGDD